MGVSEKINVISEARTWPGEFPLDHLYTVGVAGETFFREIRDRGRLIGVRCPTCALTYLPPRLYCERCLATLQDWVAVPNEGIVHSYTVVATGIDGEPLAQPETIALVRFAGVHGGLIHRLAEVGGCPQLLDLPVEAVFRDPVERTGSILDIRHFRPRLVATGAVS